MAWTLMCTWCTGPGASRRGSGVGSGVGVGVGSGVGTGVGVAVETATGSGDVVGVRSQETAVTASAASRIQPGRRAISAHLNGEGRRGTHAVDDDVHLREPPPARVHAVLELVAAHDVLEEVAVLEPP